MRGKGLVVGLLVLILFTVLTSAAVARPGRTNWAYRGTFVPLNGTMAAGEAALKLTGNGNVLLVSVSAWNVTPRQAHDMAIMGWANGDRSVCPPPEADTNGDGFISKAEAVVFTGPVLVPLGPSTRTSKESGKFVFQVKLSGRNLDKLDLGNTPLTYRTVMIFGGVWAPPYYGLGEYDPTLPAACAALHMTH